MNEMNQFGNNESEDMISEEPLMVEERPLEKMDIPKAEKISVVNSMESTITLLCTIISTSLAMLSTLNVGPFKDSSQTDDFLIISLGIPLILILLFKHLYVRIVFIFSLLWSSVLIYKYMVNNDEIEILVIIGALAFSVYFVVGFASKNLCKIVGLFRFTFGNKFSRFGGICLVVLAISGVFYYLSNKALKAEVEAFVDKKIEKVKFRLISNYIRKEEGEKFQKIAFGKSSLMTRYDSFNEINWYYGENISLRYMNSVYVYFGISNRNLPRFRFAINYVGTSSGVKSYSIKAGKKIFDIPIKSRTRKKVFVWFIETSEYEISSKELKIINLILNSKKALIRYDGEDFSFTHFISEEEKRDLLRVLNAYTYVLYTNYMMK